MPAPTINSNTLNIYCDGGARGNPGPGACAFAVFHSSSHPLYKEGQFLGHATNNQAEYQAVLNAISWAKNQILSSKFPSITHFNFFLDSQLLVNQLTGKFKIKDPRLLQLYNSIKRLTTELAHIHINYFYIPRHQNTFADNLVNQTLDLHTHS